MQPYPSGARMLPEEQRYLAGFSAKERRDWKSATGKAFPVSVFVRCPSWHVPRKREDRVAQGQDSYPLKIEAA